MIRFFCLLFVLLTSSNAHSQFLLAYPVDTALNRFRSFEGVTELTKPGDTDSHTFGGVPFGGFRGMATVTKSPVGFTTSIKWWYSDGLQAHFTDHPPVAEVADSARASIIADLGKPGGSWKDKDTESGEEIEWDLWVKDGVVNVLIRARTDVTYENWLLEAFKTRYKLSDEKIELLLDPTAAE